MVALAGKLSDWSISPCTKKLGVRSLVKAHIDVAGSIPSRGTYRRQLIDASLWVCVSVSLSNQ